MSLPTIPTVGGRSPCVDNRCSACCHDTEMLLTGADLERLKGLRPAEPFWLRADDGFAQLRTRDAPPVAGHAGRPCWFLDEDGLCTVHDARPEGCRLYPAIWDVDEHRVVLDAGDCPHTDGFHLDGATQRATADVVARLQAERPRTGSQP